MVQLQSLTVLLACAVQIISPVAAAKEGAWMKKRQAQTPYVITGSKSNGVQPRLEIRDLQSSQPDQFNVLILGLQKMQAADQADMLSYFQLAGIHGMPSADWNGVSSKSQKQGPGYCTHSSNLFLPWHRPYLALYEQVITQRAQEAADEFPEGADRDKYAKAAGNLRLPFWDWAKDPSSGDVVPAILTQPQVQVQTPTGQQNIDNPLYSYKFHPVDPGLYYQPFVNWDDTKRWPTSTDADATSQNNALIASLNREQPQIKERVFNLLSRATNFTQIGTSAWYPRGSVGQYDSLESVHDQIHGAIGGTNYGDMTVVPVSAFDPIFWLHHCQVDRLFALFQNMNPDSYVEPMAQRQGSYWFDSGAVLDANTQLLPFHSDSNGGFYTPESARDHKKFGYTYPEVAGNAADTRSAINSLYSSAGASSSQPRQTTSGSENSAPPTSAPPASAPPASGSGNSRPGNGNLGSFLSQIANLFRKPSQKRGLVDDIVKDTTDSIKKLHLGTIVQSLTGLDSTAGKHHSYQINYRCSRNSLGESFFIDFFFGKPESEDPKTWYDDKNKIATQSVTSTTVPGAPAVVVSGTCPLNNKLQNYQGQGKFKDFSEASVVNYLNKKITWRVRKLDNTAVPVDQIPDFVVSVSSVETEPSNSPDAFPTLLGDWKIYPDLTGDMKGGLAALADL